MAVVGLWLVWTDWGCSPSLKTWEAEVTLRRAFWGSVSNLSDSVPLFPPSHLYRPFYHPALGLAKYKTRSLRVLDLATKVLSTSGSRLLIARSCPFYRSELPEILSLELP